MDQGYLSYSAVLSFFGILSNLVVVFILFKRRDLRTSWNFVTIPLNISEMVFGLVNFISPIYFQLSPLQPGTWRCTLQGFLMVLCAGFSSFSLVLISLERFLAICYGQPLQMRIWLSIMFSILGYSLFIAILPLFYPAGYEIAGSGNYCIVPWYRNSWIPRLVCILSLLNFICATTLISYFYCRIFLFYRHHTRLSNRARVSNSISTQQTQPPTGATVIQHEEPPEKKAISKTTEEERKAARDRILLFKASCYIMVYAILWMPYCILIMKEMLTQFPASSTWHEAATSIAEASTLVNPLLFILLSPAFVTEIKSWFWC